MAHHRQEFHLGLVCGFGYGFGLADDVRIPRHVYCFRLELSSYFSQFLNLIIKRNGPSIGCLSGTHIFCSLQTRML